MGRGPQLSHTAAVGSGMVYTALTRSRIPVVYLLRFLYNPFLNMAPSFPAATQKPVYKGKEKRQRARQGRAARQRLQDRDEGLSTLESEVDDPVVTAHPS